LITKKNILHYHCERERERQSAIIPDHTVTQQEKGIEDEVQKIKKASTNLAPLLLFTAHWLGRFLAANRYKSLCRRWGCLVLGQ
jgi:hypothetical protein